MTANASGGTETFTTRYLGLEKWSDAEILQTIFEDQLAGVAAVRQSLEAMTASGQAAVRRLQDGDGRLVFAGAGTSARLAVQDGVELVPTFGWPEERLAYLIAGGTASLTKSIEGAEDDRDAAAADAGKLELGNSDVLVAVSASGTTPYTVTACETARRAGALTIGLSNNAPDDSLDMPSLAAASEYPIVVATGPEPIAGSTRMKAGTAQKIVLNLLSTFIMIRLGRVFGGLMVDMQATNSKLRDRARRMIGQITGADDRAAGEALAAAGGHVKLAVLVQKGLSPEMGRALLDEYDGKLHLVLETLPH